MDIATILGFLSGIGCLLFAMLMGTGVATFIHIPSMLIVMGGTFAATLINFPLPEVMKIMKASMKAFKTDDYNPSVIVPIIVSYAKRARQEGLLSLESGLEDMDNSFLRGGMRLVIDGTASEEVRETMETELEYLEERHKRAQQLFSTMAKYSPAFGMIGTLIGLVSMLKTMNDPSTIGPSMAVALITTFYGALMANLVFLPIEGKLKTRTADESLMRRIILEGILMIQAQTNPRYVGQKLVAYLPPRLREPALEEDVARGDEAEDE
jgi:chemotaxis protein MotA